MGRKIIRIDSYIGRWGYGKELLRVDLEGTLQEGALLQISSLGGDVFHALDMYNQIATHGNVEVIFTGPSASAATVLAMAAKKLSIVENCFLLVHKVMAGVDNYGLFNEEELDTLIRDLQTLQKENRQFDKVIAHIYAKRTGKSHEEIIGQMKANTWITAQEALDAGFVDQVIQPEEKLNQAQARLVAMVRDSELPIFPSLAFADTPAAVSPQEMHDDINDISMRQFPLINKTLETGSLECTEEGCYLNAEQLETIERKLEGAMQSESRLETAMAQLEESRSVAEDINSTVAALTAERDAAFTERDSAREQLRTGTESNQTLAGQFRELTDALDSLDRTVAAASGSVAKVEAVRLLLSRLPGTSATCNLDKEDKHQGADGVNWELINSLPHNLEIDQNL